MPASCRYCLRWRSRSAFHKHRRRLSPANTYSTRRLDSTAFISVFTNAGRVVHARCRLIPASDTCSKCSQLPGESNEPLSCCWRNRSRLGSRCSTLAFIRFSTGRRQWRICFRPICGAGIRRIVICGRIVCGYRGRQKKEVLIAPLASAPRLTSACSRARLGVEFMRRTWRKADCARQRSGLCVANPLGIL